MPADTVATDASDDGMTAVREQQVAWDAVEGNLSVANVRDHVYPVCWAPPLIYVPTPYSSAGWMDDLLGVNVDLQFRDYFSYVRGYKDRPLILLEDTSSFVSLMSLIYISSVRATSPLTELIVLHPLLCLSMHSVTGSVLQVLCSGFY